MAKAALLTLIVVIALPSPVVSAEGATKRKKFENVKLQQVFETAIDVARTNFSAVAVVEKGRRLTFVDDYRLVSHSVSVEEGEGGVTVVHEGRPYATSGKRKKRRGPDPVWESMLIFSNYLEGELKLSFEESRPARIEGFDLLRKHLVGKNIRAKLVLPVWVRSDGSLEFPPGQTVKPGEIATVTDVVLCSEYPSRGPRWGDEPCGHEVSEERHILVVLLNGAAVRQSPREGYVVRNPVTTTEVQNLLWTMGCVAGGLFDCAQAVRTRQVIEQERVRQEIQIQRAEARLLEEERKYRESRPEIALWLPEDASAPATPRSVKEALSIFIEQAGEAK